MGCEEEFEIKKNKKCLSLGWVWSSVEEFQNRKSGKRIRKNEPSVGMLSSSG